MANDVVIGEYMPQILKGLFKMVRIFLALSAALMILVSCGPNSNGGRPGDGNSVFRIKASDEATIQFRFLDAVNAVRVSKNLAEVELSAELIAAAKAHSFDMSRQNRPWHFGSDGSSPIERAARVGYAGTVLGETISETFEDDLVTLQAWLADSTTRDVLLDPRLRKIGLSWFQQPSGKIWWTAVTGT